ncbi:hypothetical protein HYU13_04715 [Candidatus Woesearchaeota archaeon]|nr:hypothetical protein [Candidatus Woesearchaeota archaeon]
MAEEQVPVFVEKSVWNNFTNNCSGKGIDPLQKLSELIIKEIGDNASAQMLDSMPQEDASPDTAYGTPASAQHEFSSGQSLPHTQENIALEVYGGKTSEEAEGEKENRIGEDMTGENNVSKEMDENIQSEMVSLQVKKGIIENGNKSIDEEKHSIEEETERFSVEKQSIAVAKQSNEEENKGSIENDGDFAEEKKSQLETYDEETREDVPILSAPEIEEEPVPLQKPQPILSHPNVPLTGYKLPDNNDPKLRRSTIKVPTIDQLMMRRKAR